MAKCRWPALPTGWDWICAWARSLDLKSVRPADATEHLLARLEHCRDNGLPLPAETVRLTSLLISIQGQLAVEGAEATWENAQFLVEQAYLRDHARLLSWMREKGGLPRLKPEILEPEPKEEPPTT